MLSAAALASIIGIGLWVAATHHEDARLLIALTAAVFLAFVYAAGRARTSRQSTSAATDSPSIVASESVEAASNRAGEAPSPPAGSDGEVADRAKSECLAMMSHEVRTPMNAILGMVDLLQLTELTRRQQAYVHTIQSSGNALLSLVDNVLDFSELRSGAPVIRSGIVDPRQLVEEVLEIIGFQAYSKGIEVGCRFGSGLPQEVICDKDSLHQVLVNLLTNAIKFTRRGQVTVDVDVAVEDSISGGWRIQVVDSGVGMTSAELGGLFAPLGINGTNQSGRSKGTGLGLLICKWLVEGMGGSICVEAEPGRGTTVQCTLPLRVPGDARQAMADSAALAGMRALILHCNKTMAELLRDHLESRGMYVDAVFDAGFALSRLRNLAMQGMSYDVAIIDARPRGGDGLSIARRIRLEPRIGDLPIILLTPMTFPLEIGQVSQIGNIRCVNKPVAPSDLDHNLRRLLGKGVEHGPPGAASMVGEGDPEFGGLRILVAEDNVLSRQILINILSSFGCMADAVADGTEALAALAAKPYDIALMDCEMPGLDGDEVTRRLAADPGAFASRPVIVAVTARVEETFRAKCREAGMDDFIAKPVRRKLLLDALRRWATLVKPGNRGSENSIRRAEQEILAHLRDRARSDQKFLREYIDIFVSDTASRLQLLDGAVSDQDWSTVKRQSHALKGACLEVGARSMGRQCERVRDAANLGDYERVSGVVGDLRQEFAAIRPVLESFQRGLS